MLGRQEVKSREAVDRRFCPIWLDEQCITVVGLLRGRNAELVSQYGPLVAAGRRWQCIGLRYLPESNTGSRASEAPVVLHVWSRVGCDCAAE